MHFRTSFLVICLKTVRLCHVFIDSIMNITISMIIKISLFTLSKVVLKWALNQYVF